MAQFDYLGTWIDSWDLLAAILERRGTKLVPDLWYDTAEPYFFSEVNAELKNYMKHGKRHVFIWADDFSCRHPSLRKQEEGPMAGKYSVWHSWGGGPDLSLTLPACYKDRGVIKLAHGMLSHQRSYLNSENGCWEKPSPELKAGYKDILSRMKQCLVRHMFHCYIWTGRDALRLLVAKKAKITGFGLPPE